MSRRGMGDNGALWIVLDALHGGYWTDVLMVTAVASGDWAMTIPASWRELNQCPSGKRA
jgi:hypothetical protein